LPRHAPQEPTRGVRDHRGHTSQLVLPGAGSQTGNGQGSVLGIYSTVWEDQGKRHLEERRRPQGAGWGTKGFSPDRSLAIAQLGLNFGNWQP